MVRKETSATQVNPLKSTSNFRVCPAQGNVRELRPAQEVYVELEGGK